MALWTGIIMNGATTPTDVLILTVVRIVDQGLYHQLVLNP